jgi:hypothetical protein
LAGKAITGKQVRALLDLLCGLFGYLFGVNLRLLQAVKVGREDHHEEAGQRPVLVSNPFCLSVNGNVYGEEVSEFTQATFVAAVFIWCRHRHRRYL